MKDVATFVHRAAHDLRSPLRGIHGLLRLVAQDLEGDVPHQVQQRLSMAMTEVERLDGVVERLLGEAKDPGLSVGGLTNDQR